MGGKDVAGQIGSAMERIGTRAQGRSFRVMRTMTLLLTCILSLACASAFAQKGTLSWAALDRLASLDLSKFEKEIADMGFRPDSQGNKNTSGCTTLAYLGGEINKASTMRCSNGMRTVSFSTGDATIFQEMKDAALAEGFKPQPTDASGTGQLYVRDDKQLRTDSQMNNGVAYYVVAYSGSWPK